MKRLRLSCERTTPYCIINGRWRHDPNLCLPRPRALASSHTMSFTWLLSSLPLGLNSPAPGSLCQPSFLPQVRCSSPEVAQKFACSSSFSWPLLCLVAVETRFWSLCQEDPLEKEMATPSSTLAWKIPWATIHGVTKSRTWLSDFAFTFYLVGRYLNDTLFSLFI